VNAAAAEEEQQAVLLSVLESLKELEEIYWVEQDDRGVPLNIHVDVTWLVGASLERLLLLESTLQPNHILSLNAISRCARVCVCVCVCVCVYLCVCVCVCVSFINEYASRRTRDAMHAAVTSCPRTSSALCRTLQSSTHSLRRCVTRTRASASGVL
jgi:hypothetical protein